MSTTLTPLPTAAVLRAAGPQAIDLLQAQLTQELRDWPPHRARPAALCTPQGRALADFVLWREQSGEAIDLLVDASLAEAMVRRLRMFILRLQCRVDDVSAQRPVRGLLLPDGQPDAIGPAAWSCPVAPWDEACYDDVRMIRLPDAPGVRRLLLVAESETGAAALGVLDAALPAGSAEAWALAAIRAGVPQITAPISQHFVPQMLNLELLGAVDFKKGCYPGQEVVARTQYRGSIKRRTYRVESDAALAPGDELFDPADPGQPCGMVLNAAPAGAGWEALAELKMASAAGAPRLRAADGPVLRVAALPYALPD